MFRQKYNTCTEVYRRISPQDKRIFIARPTVFMPLQTGLKLTTEAVKINEYDNYEWLQTTLYKDCLQILCMRLKLFKAPWMVREASALSINEIWNTFVIMYTEVNLNLMVM